VRVRAATLLALLALLAPSVSVALAAAARTTLPAVEGQVMCVTCKIPLAVAQSAQADRERDYIQGLIDQGQTLARIKQELVAQYGPAVLDLPAAHGFDLAAYLVPVAVVLALLATVAVLLPRWRRHARAAQAARARDATPAGALSPADAARLEADMARFD
jgi:cytochrome c-type biogenesis protein CcmH